MMKSKKIVLPVLAVIIDMIVFFLVLFLLIIGFGTTECVRCRVGDDKSLAELEAACRNYLPYFNPMFMTEISAGLAFIIMSNYLIFKSILKKPLAVTLIVSLIYLIVFSFIYHALYQNFITINLSRLTC